MVYVMADLHGAYEAYRSLLEQIHFKDSDTLFVLGDVIDRGPDSMKLLQDMMMRPNVFPILGNHEYMGIFCLRFLMQEITEESISSMDPGMVQGLLEWQNVGGQSTIDEFHRLSQEEKQDILEYLEEFELFDEVTVCGKDYILVHAGLDNFSPERPLTDYEPHELIFKTPDYSRVYFPDKYLVTGHTPTRNIDENPKPDYIYRANNNIAMDCGAGHGGNVGCICLDTGEEFYAEA